MFCDVVEKHGLCAALRSRVLGVEKVTVGVEAADLRDCVSDGEILVALGFHACASDPESSSERPAVVCGRGGDGLTTDEVHFVQTLLDQDLVEQEDGLVGTGSERPDQRDRISSLLRLR